MAERNNSAAAAPETAKKTAEAVCADISRVYDSCADKDCLNDLRVYFTDVDEEVIGNAASVRCHGCEVCDVIVEVDKIPFNKGFYSVDLTYFFKVTLDAIICPTSPVVTAHGCCVFTKKCILYGSEGNVKVFTSEFRPEGECGQRAHVTTNPVAKVQVAEPICLEAKLCHPHDCCDNLADAGGGIPLRVRNRFNGEFRRPCPDRAVKVTLGLFSIVQLSRGVQMLVPAYDFCVPAKECSCEINDNPCDAFRKIRFPIDDFFPPNRNESLEFNEAEVFSEKPCGCK